MSALRSFLNKRLDTILIGAGIAALAWAFLVFWLGP
jgi:hypothetical protein